MVESFGCGITRCPVVQQVMARKARQRIDFMLLFILFMQKLSVLTKENGIFFWIIFHLEK